MQQTCWKKPQKLQRVSKRRLVPDLPYGLSSLNLDLFEVHTYFLTYLLSGCMRIQFCIMVPALHDLLSLSSCIALLPVPFSTGTAMFAHLVRRSAEITLLVLVPAMQDTRCAHCKAYMTASSYVTAAAELFDIMDKIVHSASQNIL